MSAASDPTLLVDAKGVATRFTTARGTLHAVDGVDLTLRRGETLGIVGESGSGKSVLMRTIMGLLPARAAVSGEIQFNGADLRAMNRRTLRGMWGTQMAMVFQDPSSALNPVLKIGRQLTETLRVHRHLTRSAAAQEAISLLRQVGIPEPERRVSSYPHQLSGGMRQRVCIALAICCEPSLLIADEPTTALDVTIQRQILDLLGDLQRRKDMAMVLISHDLGVVAGRTDRVLVMYGGRVVESGGTADVFAAPRHRYTAALLDSIPRIDRPSHSRLAAIPGRPLIPIDPAAGCRFAGRCAYARERCRDKSPVLEESTTPGHTAACWYPRSDADDATTGREGSFAPPAITTIEVNAR